MRTCSAEEPPAELCSAWTGGAPVPTPFNGTIQMCGVFLFDARSTSTALNRTHLPSGEGTGSPTRFSFIMSSNVKGCLVWEKIGTTEKTVKSRMRARRMRSSADKRDSVEQRGRLRQ